MSLETPIKIRMLQRKLYQKAKEEPSYRFYLLYDKMYREDVLAHAYALVKSNQGAPGVDGQSFWGIESQGLEEWLSGIRDDLRSGVELRENAAGFLKSLMQRSRLTVHMALIEGDEAVLIEKVEPPGLVRLATWVGKRLELHCSAVGKCLLAYLPEAEFLRLVRDRGLTRNNENTITSIRKLKQQMTQIRDAGYAIEDEEGEIGCRCVGAPVFDHSGNVISAISVAGTTAQIGSEEFTYFGQLVRQTASHISEALGFIVVKIESSGQ